MDLFQMPESKSPRLRWMERHHLKVVFEPYDHQGPKEPDERYSAIHGMTKVAMGGSQDEALTNAAKKLNIRLWNEE